MSDSGFVSRGVGADGRTRTGTPRRTVNGGSDDAIYRSARLIECEHARARQRQGECARSTSLFVLLAGGALMWSELRAGRFIAPGLKDGSWGLAPERKKKVNGTVVTNQHHNCNICNVYLTSWMDTVSPEEKLELSHLLCCTY